MMQKWIFFEKEFTVLQKRLFTPSVVTDMIAYGACI